MALSPARFSLSVVSLAALLLIFTVPPPALAGTRIDPAVFALSATDFPASSHVVRSCIETNQQLLSEDVHHFGLPPGILHRRTGYYMDAVEGDPAALVHPYTSYLVSIFRTARQAQLAFAYRWDLWFAKDYYTSPSTPPIALGDKGEEALFHTLNPRQQPLSELFFVRGAVLVEVFQGTVAAGPTASQLHSFYAIATRLDALAGKHPVGV